ncbi:hypothetical protein BDW42DRAFT_169854 [Aspergillus taichungensis]|uniref:Uncharacterized protein n=1 Tax=Aspergillus taichungensis TaxID=482145 RepID=A0A2J5HUK7_9EURO|nr:hypothetical protein BDW42DRAFT_169854 [Aspergillus taichungensis]
MKVERFADHPFDIVTFILSLLALFVGWLERAPVIKWFWPRAWDRRRMARRASTDDGPVALEHPMTDLEPLQKTLEKILSRFDDLQSGQGATDDRLSRLEQWRKNHEDVPSMNMHQQQRVDALLTSLEGAVATLQARNDAPSTGCERCHVLEEATHRFLSRARAIHDRKV